MERLRPGKRVRLEGNKETFWVNNIKFGRSGVFVSSIFARGLLSHFTDASWRLTFFCIFFLVVGPRMRQHLIKVLDIKCAHTISPISPTAFRDIRSAKMIFPVARQGSGRSRRNLGIWIHMGFRIDVWAKTRLAWGIGAGIPFVLISKTGHRGNTTSVKLCRYWRVLLL